MRHSPERSMSQNRAYVYHVSLCGLLTALMLILGYVESRIPVAPAIPGIKLGLSNAVLLYAVYWLPIPLSVALMLVKVFLSVLLFGSPFALAFSLGGGVLSLCAMILARRFRRFGVVGVSVIGAVAHGGGQLAVSLWLVGNISILYYAAVLLLAGVGAGMLTGMAAAMVMKAMGKTV